MINSINGQNHLSVNQLVKSANVASQTATTQAKQAKTSGADTAEAKKGLQMGVSRSLSEFESALSSGKAGGDVSAPSREMKVDASQKLQSELRQMRVNAREGQAQLANSSEDASVRPQQRSANQSSLQKAYAENKSQTSQAHKTNISVLG